MNLSAAAPAQRRPLQRRSPRPLCQSLEHRLLLSVAPATLIGDTLVLYATSGTEGSILPSATQFTFSSTSTLNEVNLLTAATASTTYVYNPLDNTATLAVAESGLTDSFVLVFNTLNSGTYTLTIPNINNPQIQSGSFVLSTGISQLAAPSDIADEEINFQFTGGAGATILNSGTLNAQFFSNNTYTALATPTLGNPSISTGTYTFFPSAASIRGVSLLQLTETANPTKNALLAFTSAAAGTFYLTDALDSPGHSGSLTDFAYGSFTLLPNTLSPTATTLGSSLNPAPNNASVTLTASILPNLAGSHTPTGTITFREGLTPLAVASVDSTGQASFSTTSLSLGRYLITAAYSGDANFSPSTTASPFTQFITYSHAANVAYVTQVYNDLLHRAPDGPGLDFWTNRLDSANATLADVATALTSSREYDGIVVDSFYVQYLGRHSEINGLNFWVDQMQNRLNAEVIRAGILGSDEYYNRIGTTDTAYITILYANFLNRTPDDNGLQTWLAQLDHSTPAAATNARTIVSSSISNSTESRTTIATGFYQTFLHRAPDDAGLQVWITNLANGVTQPQIISFFVTTQEYLNLHNIT